MILWIFEEIYVIQNLNIRKPFIENTEIEMKKIVNLNQLGPLLLWDGKLIFRNLSKKVDFFVIIYTQGRPLCKQMFLTLSE
mgnify:CR=1 FL=1